METQGCSVNVYKDGSNYDCTANGITSKHDNLILIDENGGNYDCPHMGSFENTVKLVKRDLWGKEYLHAEPLVKPKGMVGPMFGGNFIYTSDSRFPSSYPIPVHDRFETKEFYNSMEGYY